MNGFFFCVGKNSIEKKNDFGILPSKEEKGVLIL